MPDEYTLTLTPLGLIFRTSEALAMAAQEVRGTLQAVVSDLEREVKLRTPRGVFGALKDSVAGEVSGEGLDLHGVVGATASYAPVVELGRRKGSWPPLGPIELWVRRKLGVPKEEARGVAWAVAGKLRYHDLPGRFMFRDALADRRTAYEDWWKDTLQRVAERLEGD